MPRKLKASPFADVPQSDFDIEQSREDNTLGKILSQYRKQKGLSLDGLNQALAAYGVVIGSKSINKWETGICTPNAYQFLALCRALEIRDPMYIFTGDSSEVLNEEGLRKLTDYKEDLIASGRYKKELRPLPVGKIVHMREMKISTLRVSAGTGSLLDEGNFELRSFPEDAVPAEADFGVIISGDSMEPFYHDGSIAWVKLTDNIRPSEVGVFQYDGEGYIKVYEETTAKGHGKTGAKQSLLVSYNEKYAPRPVNSAFSFEVIGKVLN